MSVSLTLDPRHHLQYPPLPRVPPPQPPTPPPDHLLVAKEGVPIKRGEHVCSSARGHNSAARAA